MNEKMNIQELAALLAEKSGMTKKEAESFLKECFDTLSEALLSDRVVKVKNLGTFKLALVNDRESIDVATGERVLIPAHHKATFAPENSLAQAINEPFSYFEPVELSDDDLLINTAETIVFDNDDDDDLHDDGDSDFELILEDENDVKQNDDSEALSKKEKQPPIIERTQTNIVPPTVNAFNSESLIERMQANITLPTETTFNSESLIERIQANITLPTETASEQIDRKSINFINKNVNNQESKIQHLENDIEIKKIVNHGFDENIGLMQDNINIQIDELRNATQKLLQMPNDDENESILSQTQKFSIDADLQAPELINNHIVIPETITETNAMNIGTTEEFYVPFIDEDTMLTDINNSPIGADNVPADVIDTSNYFTENVLESEIEKELTNKMIEKKSKIETEQPEMATIKTQSNANNFTEGKLYDHSLDRKTKSHYSKLIHQLRPLIYGCAIFATVGAFYYLYSHLDYSNGPAPIINTIGKKTPNVEDVIVNIENQPAITGEDSLINQAISVVEKMGISLNPDSTALTPNTTVANKSNNNKPQTPSLNQALDAQPKSTNNKSVMIQNGQTLARLAMDAYGNKCFWIYIYEENKNIIKNPHSVSAGLTVTIPPAEKYHIDKNDPASVKKANDMANKLNNANFDF